MNNCETMHGNDEDTEHKLHTRQCMAIFRRRTGKVRGTAFLVGKFANIYCPLKDQETKHFVSVYVCSESFSRSL